MTNSKRQDLPGEFGDGTAEPAPLCVVATPIGNLRDIGPRAIEAMEKCDTLLCEDTRRAARLIAALGIRKSMSRLERLDAHASQQRLQTIVGRMRNGETFALVTDAGTPAISDPGTRLVGLARDAGLAVTPVPGPSAVMALLSAAGLEAAQFAFLGFFPRKTGDQKRVLERARSAAMARVFVWFESPQRVSESLRQIAQTVPEARVVAAKELTKLHEKFFSGRAEEVSERVSQEISEQGARGEWCFALEFPEKSAGAENSSDWVKALHCLIDARVSASEAATRVSQCFGVSKKQVYDEALIFSGKKKQQGG